MTADNNVLNPDAIYAGLVYMRDYAESDEADAMQRHADALSATSAIRQVPRFNFGPELFEEIYPGERTSVEVGLELRVAVAIGIGACVFGAIDVAVRFQAFFFPTGSLNAGLALRLPLYAVGAIPLFSLVARTLLNVFSPDFRER